MPAPQRARITYSIFPAELHIGDRFTDADGVGDRVPAPGLQARTRNTRSRSTNRRSSHAAEHQLAGSETPRHPTPVLSERHGCVFATIGRSLSPRAVPCRDLWTCPCGDSKLQCRAEGIRLTRVELVQHVDSADLVRKSPSLAEPRSKKDRLKISICILRLDC